MFDQWRGVVAQVFGGLYLVATSWTDVLDVVVKAGVGIFMMGLLFHQIDALRRRKRYVLRLEGLLREARARCAKAARGQCWIEEEVVTENEKGPKV